MKAELDPNMLCAVRAVVQEGMALREAARKYRVPRTTLQRRIHSTQVVAAVTATAPAHPAALPRTPTQQQHDATASDSSSTLSDSHEDSPTVYYGDLLLPNPSCTSYAPQANIAGRNMFWLPTNPGDRWVLKPEVLEEHCAKDPKAPRVLILNSPSNPTGTVYREDELKALAEVARRYRVLVISDEIYSELHHVGAHHSISKFYPEGTIVSGGLSKWCGAGGWRMGFWLFPASMAWLRHSMIVMASETYTSVASPIQHAARRAFVPDCIELAAYKEKCCKILKIIGLWCCHELREMRVTVLDPEGGFYVFPCFGTQRELLADRGILTDIELCQRVLNDTGVALLPGSAFGRDPTELYVRVAFVDFKGDIALYLIESMADQGAEVLKPIHVPPPDMPQVEPTASAIEPSPARAAFKFVELPSWGFRLAWVMMLTLHGLCAFYFILNAHVYDKTPGSALETALVAYNVGMPMDAYDTLMGVHAAFAAIHILLGAVMVLYSLWKRRFSFGPLQELGLDGSIRPTSKVASSNGNRRFSSLTSALSAGSTESGRLHAIVTAGTRWMQLVAALYSRQGFFGVEGKYFDEILTVREIVESALQAYQAYRMSQLLARPWLNRFYVTMLVVNCWMVPIVHFVCRHRVMHRRALGLLFDATLDFTSAMVVPTVLLFSYYPDFDVPSWGFPYTLWFDDMWVVNVVTEFQIMLVTSWGDLASRCVFSIGLISCIESAKELLRESSPADAKRHARAKHQVPIADAKEQTLSPAAAARPSIAHARAWSSFRQLRHASLRRMLQSLQVMCAALGAVVVVLHMYAESASKLDNCLIQVHPWLERKPACVLLQWDCHTRLDSGDAAAITAQWSKTSPAYVRRVLLLHCYQLQMPPLVTAFHEMTGMKVYNSTIAAWNSDAALTATNHPRMVLAYFVRVNTSSTGELPPGLMTAPFPPTLWDIEFAVSNLRKLPDDLDTKWPLGLYFTCERCEFTAVPPAIVRLMPYWITFAENPFTGFPFEVFQIPVLEHFGLAGVPLPSLLPPTQGDSFLQDTSVRYLYLAGTNVTWLPRWVDAFAALPRSLWYQPALDLTFTPMCEAIGQMQAGTLERFPPEWTANVPADQLSRYMTVTRSNVSALDGVVGCFAFSILGYPLDDEDGRYML
ncbi:hypothetical protein P43SY_004642 [Pythium insidiosum]|uniref:HTH psq-type domain-containing protein n=1 Tax=Pythium insidiosum TaxID=114742 RepID=A0AAD5Q343_PYTIN|nr:hypothetical protein P43SY_004642 [Pythium insidiosum]